MGQQSADICKPVGKANHAEVEARVQQCYQWLSECKSTATILRLGAETWGLKTRMIEEYIAKARKRILAEWSQVDRREWIANAMSRLDKVAEMSVEQRQHSNAIGAMSLQAKLLGVTRNEN